jgi:signal transduction histidine kinase
MLCLSIGIHFSIRFVIDEETDENLERIAKIVIEQIENGNPLTSLEPYISVHPTEYSIDTAYFFNSIFQKGEMQGEEYRQFTTIKNIDNETYQIIIREIIVESHELLETISILTIFSLLLLLILLYFANRKISKSVWLVFYKNLEKLKQFSLTDLIPFEPEQSDISEFQELNEVVKSLSEKVIKDYNTLKQFSEDASHELQTPLAVIRSKIESLLDGDLLNEVQSEKMQSIYNSVNKLSRINKGLLLLTKIDNNQFSQSEILDVNRLIETKIEYFNELAEIKGLTFKYNHLSEWQCNANPYLFDILLNNLLSNAITHSNTKGNINITLENNKLILSNPGQRPIENIERLFERFYKESNSNSVGLGLAISKQICYALGLNIACHFEKNTHFFTISEKL